MQWQHRLEEQGLLIPKCIHHHRGGVYLLVPDELREPWRRRGLRELDGISRPTAGAEPGRYTRPREGTGRYVRPRAGAGRYALEHGRTSRPWHPVMIHPGSGGRAKCWPLSCFIDVARRLRESDEDVCFIVGPVEAERWSSNELDAIRNEFPLIESPSPNDLLHLLASAHVLIGNDAGPAHLAALLGTPTLTIFGTTSPTVWRPLGPNARHIKGDPTSSPNGWGIDPTHVAAIATSKRR